MTGKVRLFCELLSSNNLMYQVKTPIIRKLTFLHTLDSHWEIYKKCDKVKEITAQSYQKTLNRNNISRRALGLSLCFVTVWGRYRSFDCVNNPLLLYFYLFLSCEENSWHNLQPNVPSLPHLSQYTFCSANPHPLPPLSVHTLWMTLT